MTTATRKSGEEWGRPLLGLFLLLIFGSLLTMRLWNDVRANYFYTEGSCLLLDKRIVGDPEEGTTGEGVYRPEFLIRYTAEGQDYEVWTYDIDVLFYRCSTALRWPKECTLRRFTIGEEYPCWYDPADPSQVILVRGYSGIAYALLMVVVVLASFTAATTLSVLWNRRRVPPRESAEAIPEVVLDRRRLADLDARECAAATSCNLLNAELGRLRAIVASGSVVRVEDETGPVILGTVPELIAWARGRFPHSSPADRDATTTVKS